MTWERNPAARSELLTVRVTPATAEALHRIAERTGQSVSFVASVALNTFVLDETRRTP